MGAIVFVSGTDTGVGKTIASAWLALEAKGSGLAVAYCKPIQTGVQEDEPGDAAMVAAIASVEVHELARLAAPLAPAVAANLEGRTLDVNEISDRIRKHAADVDLLIVEGAGGLLVPINETATMIDLAGNLGSKIALVARPGLGTLNHIALSLEACTARGLVVDRLILSDWPDDPSLVEQTNVEYLSRGDLTVECLPHLRNLPHFDTIS